MKPQKLCCREITGRHSGELPFNRMLVLNWYDGPTSGVIACDVCNTEYSFVLVDWDSFHEVRIFGLTPLAPGSIDRLVEFFGEPPEWPVWFPKKLIAPTEHFRSQLFALERVIETSSQPDLIIAWSRSRNIVLAAKPAEPRTHPTVKYLLDAENGGGHYDWFRFLELPRA